MCYAARRNRKCGIELRLGHNRVVAVGAALAAFAASIFAIRFSPLPFVAPIWHSEWASADGWSPVGSLKIRHRMADSLVDSDLVIGKSKGQITALLGEPLVTDYFREFDLVYVLGTERGFIAIDNEWLVIKLDVSGRATSAQVVRD